MANLKKVKQIVQFLIANPGYAKWGLDKLSSFTGYNKEDIIQAKLEIKLSKVPTPVKPTLKRVPKAATISVQPTTVYDSKNVIAIADMHEPFCKEGYIDHVAKVKKDYKCGKVVLIGDEVDLCAISQWEKDPDGFSAGTEADLAQYRMEEWYKRFPEAMVCIGNHTARPFRMAKSNGIPKKFLKSYEEAWGAPKGWRWAEHWEVDGVLYTHGTGFSGANAAIRIATRHRQNTVIGHIHSEAGIQFSASKIDLVWGMQLGGALDDKTYAAHYAKDQLKKSIIGVGVVLGGKLPIYLPMNL